MKANVIFIKKKTHGQQPSMLLHGGIQLARVDYSREPAWQPRLVLTLDNTILQINIKQSIYCVFH